MNCCYHALLSNPIIVALVPDKEVPAELDVPVKLLRHGNAHLGFQNDQADKNEENDNVGTSKKRTSVKKGPLSKKDLTTLSSIITVAIAPITIIIDIIVNIAIAIAISVNIIRKLRNLG